MDRAIKKTIRQRVGIVFLHPAFFQPGLFQPVTDLIDFLFGKEATPAPAAQAKPRLLFAMRKRIPTTLKQTDSIKRLKHQVITRKVNQIATTEGLTEEQEKDLLVLVKKDRTEQNDREIRQFIMNKKIENIITKKKLQLTTTQTDTVTRLSILSTPESERTLMIRILEWEIDKLSVENKYTKEQILSLKKTISDPNKDIKEIDDNLRKQVIEFEIAKIKNLQKQEQLQKMLKEDNFDQAEKAILRLSSSSSPRSPRQVLHLSTATLSPPAMPSPKNRTGGDLRA
jgi:hypothetical protein